MMLHSPLVQFAITLSVTYLVIIKYYDLDNYDDSAYRKCFREKCESIETECYIGKYNRHDKINIPQKVKNSGGKCSTNICYYIFSDLYSNISYPSNINEYLNQKIPNFKCYHASNNVVTGSNNRPTKECKLCARLSTKVLHIICIIMIAILIYIHVFHT